MVRFIYGLLMNFTALQCVYIQERLPAEVSNQGLVLMSLVYTLTVVVMSWSCSGLTLTMDWRMEALLWYAILPMSGLFVAFPDWWNILRSFPMAVASKSRRISWSAQVEEGVKDDTLTLADKRNIAFRHTPVISGVGKAFGFVCESAYFAAVSCFSWAGEGL